MSGICAVWHRQNSGHVSETLTAVADGLSLASERAETLADRDAGVGVAARFATQQIHQDGHVLIAIDADLHNETELAASIGAQDRFTGNARTAALVAALYERFGCDFAEKLRGAFSVVLWDARERRVVAAIDGFGINRLVYYQDKNILVVASRIHALARAGGVDLEVNPRAIVNILNFTASLAPETVFGKVQRLSPGTVVVASDEATTVQKYWDMRYYAGCEFSEERLSQELESVVERSVAAHCKNEESGGLGAFLSGGTDSSTVVGMMSRAAKCPVKAFSIGFEEQPFNELGYAELAARKFAAEHYTYLVGPRDCFEALPRMIRYFDEPFGNASAIPTYFCARLAAEHGVKVLLAGDGGDELFGGNERYQTDKIFEVYHTIPHGLRKGLIEPVLAALPQQPGLVKRARGYVRRANLPGAERMFTYQFLATHSPTEVFESDFLEALGAYSFLAIPSRHYAAANARDHLDRLLYVDMKITLADNDLPKVTCTSELAGVQARFPFLDRSVAEFSGRIPARLKVKGFEKRYLFKRAFRDLLPIEIIRKKKHGFGIPVSTWMKSDKRMRELSRDTLLSSRAFGRGYFRRQFIEDLFRRHEQDDSTYYGDTLWTFLALELWHRQTVDEPAKVTA